VVRKALARLAQDKSRIPRMTAIRAFGKMQTDVPEDVLATLPLAFRGAPESDKLSILVAARSLGAGDVVGVAITDPSVAVRVAAIDTAVATSTEVAMAINSALADPSAVVRRAALERLASGKSGLGSSELEAALRLAIRDDNETISDLALATMGRVGELEAAKAELTRRLGARSERVRAQAARAAIGLAETDARAAIELLEPLQDDPSHDVRVALIPSLGKAMAVAMDSKALAKAVRKAERHTTRRLVALAALLTLAGTEAGASEAKSLLESIDDKGRPMAKVSARLGLGLIEGKANGLGFLQSLVP
jgi:hypothetical protein